MQTCLLKKGITNFYHIVHSTDGRLRVFGYFLTDDVGSFLPSWRAWLRNDAQKDTSSNATALHKEGDRVFLESVWLEDGPRLDLPLKELMDVVEQWAAVRKAPPQFITVFMKDDKIWLRGHNDRCPIDDAQLPHVNQ